MQAGLEIRRDDPTEPQLHADLTGADREEPAAEPQQQRNDRGCRRETARADEKFRSRSAILSRSQTHSSGTRVRHMLTIRSPESSTAPAVFDGVGDELGRSPEGQHGGQAPRLDRAH